jgi:hypothetical protein
MNAGSAAANLVLVHGGFVDGRSRRSCRPSTGSCSWTGTSSTTPSPAMCPPSTQRSWPTRRFRGGGRAWRNDHRGRLAVQAELVPAHHRRPDDSPAGPADHVRAGRCHGNRGRGQPLRLCVAACSGSRPRQTGRVRGGRTAVVPASFSPTRRTASVAELLVPSAVRVVTAVTQSPAAYAGSQVC